ncbi:MAG: acyl-CoA thioesterase [Fuerstiella sp.]|nr:acyl-CoA thioesterase [Fuerstiella sp.]
MASSYSMTRVVEFSETDMAGIAHFSNFYTWMEQAEHAFFRSLDLTIANNQTDGTTIGFPRVAASCRFVSPAKFEDTVTVQLRVQRIGVKSLTYEAIFSIDDRLVANGTLKTVCCRFRSGESLDSIEIPDLYLSKLEEFSE